MAQTTTLTRIDKNNEALYNEVANASFRGGESSSPFKEGTKFKLSPEKYCFTRSERGNVFVVALVLDEQGKEQELYLSMLLKSDIGESGKVENNSQLAKALQAKITPQTTNKQAGEIIAELIGNKTIICKRQHYIRYYRLPSGVSKPIPSSLVGFDFE